MSRTKSTDGVRAGTSSALKQTEGVYQSRLVAARNMIRAIRGMVGRRGGGKAKRKATRFQLPIKPKGPCQRQSTQNQGVGDRHPLPRIRDLTRQREHQALESPRTIG